MSFPAYPPPKKPEPVVKPGEFVFSAMYFDHAHLTGMTWALLEAGATLKSFYDPDPRHVESFLRSFPDVHVAQSEEEILADPEVRLVCGACVTSQRCDLGIRVMEAGKDYFTDKAPMTTLLQVERAREACARTGCKYLCYYGERLCSEAAGYAMQMIEAGAIGRVIHMEGFGPHRLNPGIRPDWFFEREPTGGILCDIGSHQLEQFLAFAGEQDADVVYSRVGNYGNHHYPTFEDFGDCMVTGKNGATFYFRVDWFTPDGLRTWGDNRTVIVGTKGTIELRKTIDPGAPERVEDTVIWVDGEGEHRTCVHGELGQPFFGQMILDCIHRTEHAMTQVHCFKAAELCIRAEAQAVRVG